MADSFIWNGDTYPIQSWDGGRLNTKAHGPGTLVDTDGDTYQCSLNQGVISGYCWRTDTDGDKVAAVYNTQGMRHGATVVFRADGDIYLTVWNNGKWEGSSVQGMMCIQYI